jgi:integrase
MGYTKDLWTRPEKQPDGKTKRVPNARHGKGKRWLACWLDPDGQEKAKAFATKTPADKYWRDQEAARDRGEYVDPKAGRELVSDLAARWLASVSVDPATEERYDEIWRLHVKEEFGKRKVKTMTKPSEIQSFLSGLSRKYSDSTVGLARLVLGGLLELAVADGDLRANPVRSRVVSISKRPSEKIVVRSDAEVWALIDGHPESLRALPLVGATAGLREGELFGLAERDIDFDRRVLHVRQQVKRLGTATVFGLPKNDSERIVPMADATAEVLRAYMARFKPAPVTLPWERPDGQARTLRLVFLHPDTAEYLRTTTYKRYWDPALQAAGIIGAPVKAADGRQRYVVGEKNGRHLLRHYYAATQLAGGTNIRELADYLGHHDPAFTLRIYGHLVADSHDRARRAIDDRFFRPRAVSHGTTTEQGVSR